MQKQSRLSKFSCVEFSRLKGGDGAIILRTYAGGGGGGSEIGYFTAYVLYGCPLIRITRLKIVCIVSRLWFDCGLTCSISFYDIQILKGGWKVSLAQILIKLETLSLSMICRVFLIFWRFWALGSYKKDSYKKETVLIILRIEIFKEKYRWSFEIWEFLKLPSNLVTKVKILMERSSV